MRQPKKPKVKMYKSVAWLKRHHYTMGKSIDQIAQEQDVAPMTIRREMNKHQLKILK